MVPISTRAQKERIRGELKVPGNAFALTEHRFTHHTYAKDHGTNAPPPTSHPHPQIFDVQAVLEFRLNNRAHRCSENRVWLQPCAAQPPFQNLGEPQRTKKEHTQAHQHTESERETKQPMSRALSTHSMPKPRARVTSNYAPQRTSRHGPEPVAQVTQTTAANFCTVYSHPAKLRCTA